VPSDSPNTMAFPSGDHELAKVGESPMGSGSGVPPAAEIMWRATVGCLATKLIRFPSGDQSASQARKPLASLSFWLPSTLERHSGPVYSHAAFFFGTCAGRRSNFFSSPSACLCFI
jgi:hypothetical protein